MHKSGIPLAQASGPGLEPGIAQAAWGQDSTWHQHNASCSPCIGSASLRHPEYSALAGALLLQYAA